MCSSVCGVKEVGDSLCMQPVRERRGGKGGGERDVGVWTAQPQGYLAINTHNLQVINK